MLHLYFIVFFLANLLELTSATINNGVTDYLTYDPSGFNKDWPTSIAHLSESSDLPECNLNTTGYCTIDGVGVAYINEEATMLIKRDNFFILLVETLISLALTVQSWQQYASQCVSSSDERSRYFSGSSVTTLIASLLYTLGFIVSVVGISHFYDENGNKEIINRCTLGMFRQYDNIRAFFL